MVPQLAQGFLHPWARDVTGKPHRLQAGTAVDPAAGLTVTPSRSRPETDW